MKDVKKVFIETYGCAANQSHSEKMAGLISDSGYALVELEKEADVIILNTCIVKKPTEQKMLEKIKTVRKKFPYKKLILAGCLPEIPELLKKADYDAVLGAKESDKIMNALNEVFNAKSHGELPNNTNNPLPKIRNNPLIHIEEIASGCLGSCSYCIVKRAKGNLKSEHPDAIARNVEKAVKEGCREIWLTAQDTACYGFDNGTSLSELIDLVCRIDSDFKIHVGMMNPEHAIKILPNLIESYRNERVYKFLHLPVQSGSDDILKKMNRNYTAENFIKIVSEFRKTFPMIQIWTDVIVGFPGETEDDFEKTLSLVREINPDFVNVSRFGMRTGTPAEKLEQVQEKIKKERNKKLSEMLKQIYLENNEKWIDWKGKVLITEKRKNGFLGRNFAYKPIHIRTDKDILGKQIDVKIVSASSSALFGEIIG